MNFFKHKKEEENIINPDEQKVNQLLEMIKNHYGTRKFEVKNKDFSHFTKDDLFFTLAHFNGNNINENNANWDSPVGFLLQNNQTENLNFTKEDILFLLKKCNINLTHGNGVSIASLLVQNNTNQNIHLNTDEMIYFLEKADLSIVNTNNESVFGTILGNNQTLHIPKEMIDKWAVKAVRQTDKSQPIGKDILNYLSDNEQLIAPELATLIIQNQQNLSSYQKQQYESNYQEIFKKIEKIYPNRILDVQKEKTEKQVKSCLNGYRGNVIKDSTPQIK